MCNKFISKVMAVFVAAISPLTCAFAVGAAAESSSFYCGGSTYVEQTEQITYASKITEEYHIVGNLPNFYGLYLENSCANLAGAIIIAYYDRFYEDLIPDYTSYAMIGTNVVYKGMTYETQSVAEELYDLMQTNVTAGGTTYNNFNSGLKSYVNGQGYSYSTANVNSSNLASYKTAVESGKPVAIFANGFSFLTEQSTSGTTETIAVEKYTATHVVVACGYKIDTYYNANGSVIATRTYLKVVSGLMNYKIAYLCLDNKTTLDHMIAITIS